MPIKKFSHCPSASTAGFRMSSKLGKSLSGRVAKCQNEDFVSHNQRVFWLHWLRVFANLTQTLQGG